jgi:hypothetical protein
MLVTVFATSEKVAVKITNDTHTKDKLKKRGK